MKAFSCFFRSYYNGNMKLDKASHTVYKTKISYCLGNRYLRKILVTEGKKLFELIIYLLLN